MTRSAVLLISVIAAASATVGDYLVGRLVDSPSLGVAFWAGAVVLVSAVIDAHREWDRKHGRNGGAGYATTFDLTILNNMLRGVDALRWGTIISSIAAAVCAAGGAYIFVLATFALRYTAVPGGPKLGEHSSYDRSAVTHIVEFQTSSTILWFVIACFFLALLLRPPALLPLGVMGVPLANAASAPLAPLTRNPDGPSSQLTQTLVQPDAWFFQVPPGDVFWACLAALAAGVVICWGINGLLALAK